MPSFSSVYTAVGCNKASAVADSRADGLVVYGGGRLLCFWQSADVTSAGVYLCLRGHEAQITAVKFVQASKRKEKQRIIATGDAAGQLRIWEENDEETGHWKCTLSESGHIGSLAALACVYDGNGNAIVVTGGSDCQLKVWMYSQSQVSIQQTIDTKGKLPMALAVSALPGSNDILIASATTDLRIALYTKGSKGEFAKIAALEGHSDWIRCLSFSPPIDDGNHILLASGAQDAYVRLWRISKAANAKTSDADLDELDLESHTYQFNSQPSQIEWAATSESVLLGHEGWITDVQWCCDSKTTPKLLSSSSDRSVIMWICAQDGSYWTNEHRLGELGGASGLGFFGALPGKDGNSVIAHDFAGSMHIWRREKGGWRADIGVSGHLKEVTALQWQPRGHWLMSSSLDQTTRLYGPWNRNDTTTWHELARPQIHGHDIYALANLDTEHGLKFASGSDEMIVRLFEAPRTFLESATNIIGCEMPDASQRPAAAVIPALGLSNRVAASGGAANSENSVVADDAIKSRPPVEDELVATTLWPEYDKLYGHGFELRTLAVSHEGRLLASTCRSSSADHATIHLRSTFDMKLSADPLEGHTLAITRVAFSPDDRHILSVGRDRSWHLHAIQPGVVPNKESFASFQKAHSRVIFDCCWLSNTVFATASRDKTVKMWHQTEGQQWECSQTLSFAVACTALAFDGQSSMLAIGQENGDVCFYTASPSNPPVLSESSKHPDRLSAASSITTLAYAPSNTPDSLRLAIASSDHAVRIVGIAL